ncbi:MAG: alpha/beta hydrolase [Saprospiraceae bacterium]|nr:alpha/beta hydrolase [Saprospiraceae bacterium]
MRTILPLVLLILSVSTNAQPRHIQMDGRKVWVHTIGTAERNPGQPILVFESGLGTPLDHWDPILEAASSLGPVLLYDRPGIGRSDPDDAIPTIEYVAEHLLRLLDHLELPPPYVLIGHSLGGVYVRGFAGYYPETLAGLVIIDPADFTETEHNKRDHFAVFDWDVTVIDSILAARSTERARRRARAPLAIQEEGQALNDLRKTDFTVLSERPLPNIPVHIIAGGRFDMPLSMRSKTFDELVLFQSKMRHRVARWTEVVQGVDHGALIYCTDAGHFVHRDQPEIVLASISKVLQDFESMRK